MGKDEMKGARTTKTALKAAAAAAATADQDEEKDVTTVATTVATSSNIIINGLLCSAIYALDKCKDVGDIVYGFGKVFSKTDCECAAAVLNKYTTVSEYPQYRVGGDHVPLRVRAVVEALDRVRRSHPQMIFAAGDLSTTYKINDSDIIRAKAWDEFQGGLDELKEQLLEEVAAIGKKVVDLPKKSSYREAVITTANVKKAAAATPTPTATAGSAGESAKSLQVVKKKKQVKIVIGQAEGQQIRASAVRPIRVFVSRCSPDTTEKSMELFVKSRGWKTIKVEKLRTEYDTYSSFKVIINGHGLNNKDIFNSSLWPTGLFVREWFEKRKDRNTNRTKDVKVT